MSGEVSSAETSRYLIHELESVVNDEYLTLLRDSEHTFSIRGYRPSTHFQLPDIIGLELTAAWLVPDELEGIDVHFAFPANDPYGSIKHYLMQWRNGVNWTYAETEHMGPVAYAGHGDRIIGLPSFYRADDIPALVEAAGLPFDHMAGSGADTLEALLTTFSQQSQWMHLSRERKIPLNPYSSLRVVQDNLLLREGKPAEPELVQELRLEVRHFEDFAERYPAAAVLKLDTVHPIRAQHIVFHRNQEDSQWNYYASYDGPIAPGELPGEYKESIDRLIAPPRRLAIQIDEALQSLTS